MSEERMRRAGGRRGRTWVALLVCGGIVLAAGAAYAYFRGAGSGSSSATTGNASAMSLSPGTPSAQLYPGGTANVVLTVTNTNAARIRIGSIALDTTQGSSGFAVDAGHSGCGLATLSLGTQTNGGSGWTVNGNATLSVTLTNALSMGATAANACQGAAFTVYLRVAS